MKSILHLNLKREWFDKIANKEKFIEYRAYNMYWFARLMCLGKDKVFHHIKFDEVHFKNGFKRKNGKEAPFMRIEHKTTISYCTENPMTLVKEKMFLISLGDILEIKNWDGVK